MPDKNKSQKKWFALLHSLKVQSIAVGTSWRQQPEQIVSVVTDEYWCFAHFLHFFQFRILAQILVLPPSGNTLLDTRW